MTFPSTPLDLRAELLINNAWTNVSSRLDRGDVEIGRGHPDESLTVSASTLAMPLNNSDGALSMSNPNSPYYPYLVRNTRARVSVPAQFNHLRLEDDLPGSEGMAYASCPDAAALDVSGTLDLRVWLHLDDWSPSVIASKWASPTDRSWCLYLPDLEGHLRIEWITSSGNDFYVTSPVPLAPVKQAVRVVLAAAGSLAFYTGPSLSGPWTQLGTTLTFAAFSFTGTTAPLCVGYSPGFIAASGNTAYHGMRGRVYGLQLYSGSTLVASPDFTAAAEGAATVTDGQGNPWTMSNGAWVSGRSFRGHFEVPAFSQSGDPRWKDVTVSAEGGGLLRRLSQRQLPVQSPMYRAELLQQGGLYPVQYWPCEQDPGSTSASSATGGPPMIITGGTGDGTVSRTGAGWGQDTSFVASAPLPLLNGSAWHAVIPSYPAGSASVIRFLLRLGDTSAIPAGGTAGIMEIYVGPKTAYVNAYNGGAIGFALYNGDGSLNHDTGPISYRQLPGPMWVSMDITQVSGGVQYSLLCLSPGGVASEFSYQLGGGAVHSAVAQIRVNPQRALTDTAIGHISIQNNWTSMYDLGPPLNAWEGESASDRFLRLCSENGVPARLVRPGDGAPMGQQSQSTITQLLTEVQETDTGVWLEPRDSLSWGWIPSAAMVQDPVLTLDYAQGMLGEWSSAPTEDDQTIVNDVTVSGSDGTSARQYAAPGQAIDGGRLSVLEPPDGSNRYDTSVQANPADPSQLDDIAAWLVHAGTVDEPRLPGITLDLTAGDLASVFYAVLDLDVAQILQINNLPPNLRPGSLRNVAQQLNETLGHKTLSIGVTGVPASVWNLVVLDDATRGRLDTDGSQLAAAAGAGAAPVTWGTTAAWAAWSGTSATVTPSGSALTITSTGPTGGFWQGFGPAQPVSAGQTVSVVAVITAAQALGAVSVGVHFAGSSDTFTKSAPVAVAAGQTVTVCVTATAAAGQTSWSPYVVDAENSPAGYAMTAQLAYGGVATALSVATTGTVLWDYNNTTVPYDIAVGGERMTVTRAAGTSSPQTLTVVRSVNGVSKAHAAGDSVSLWQPNYLAIGP